MVERYTVKFLLKEPLVWLLNVWPTPCSMWIIATEVVKQYGDLKKVETAITPAFLLGQYQPNVKAVFKRNPDYFRPGLPYVDGVEWLMGEDESNGLAMYRAGQLDMDPGTNWAVRQADLEALKKSHPHLHYQDRLSNPAGDLMQTDQPPSTTCGCGAPSRRPSIVRRLSTRYPSERRAPRCRVADRVVAAHRSARRGCEVLSVRS